MDTFQLSKLINKETLKSRVTCFKGDEYPCLFFSLLFKSFKNLGKWQVNFIKVDESDFSNLKLNLEQCFLGNDNLFFWVGDISNFKKRNEFISYLYSYTGPHSIGFFINNEQQIDSNFVNEIDCGYVSTIEQINSYLFLWDKQKHKIILQFLRHIYKKTNRLTLDQVCIFANYVILLGNKYSNFIDDWLENILVNDYSLFTLSKYFFSCDSKLFFNYWNSISKNFAPVFWTTFWSEQLYRAVNFIELRNEGKNLQAKQIAYKLPFSFIQNDWKKFTINELKNSHRFIYEIDYSVKNGASNISFDLFFGKFFEKEFR